MKRLLTQRTRNRIFLVTAGMAIVGLLAYGVVSAYHLYQAYQMPAKAVNAEVPSSDVSDVVSVMPSSAVTTSLPSSAPSSKASSSRVNSKSPASSSPEESEEKPTEHSSKSTASLPSGKTVYLTFDDGPSSLTVPLLDVLDQYQVKATFFVVGVNDKNETRDLKEIVNRGHAIGVHSWSHNYRKIYASPQAFFEDYDKIHQAILDATGVDTKIYRFPGGSVNGYNSKTRTAICAELKSRGVVYFDWNAGGDDAGGQTTPDGICRKALQNVHAHRVSVVLFHNTSAKSATLKQMPKFISTLQKEGYKFDVLSDSVNNAPFIF
jgi:peptidoglycan/xylan/chitin deacetylase (PgdA/CDA1 family)